MQGGSSRITEPFFPASVNFQASAILFNIRRREGLLGLAWAM